METGRRGWSPARLRERPGLPAPLFSFCAQNYKCGQHQPGACPHNGGHGHLKARLNPRVVDEAVPLPGWHILLVYRQFNGFLASVEAFRCLYLPNDITSRCKASRMDNAVFIGYQLLQ